MRIRVWGLGSKLLKGGYMRKGLGLCHSAMSYIILHGVATG